jgi:hypothetical protein
MLTGRGRQVDSPFLPYQHDEDFEPDALLSGFLAADPDAREQFPARLGDRIRRTAERIARDLKERGLIGEVVQQTYELLLRRPAEVCFARLAGAPLTARKTSWAGAERRRALLAGAGISLAGDLGGAGAHVGIDDVLDAGAAAWAARQVLRGHAQPIPDPPETFSDGWPCAIWS